MFCWKAQSQSNESGTGSGGIRYLGALCLMKSHDRDFCSETPCFRILQGEGMQRGVIFIYPSIKICPALSQKSWGLKQWGWGDTGLLGISPDLAGLRKTCYRINVLCDSSLAYLVFTRWLVLIKGIWHVQRPLFSSASVCPHVISLFKLCLRLCQVLTVALQEGNRIYLLNRCCTLMDMFWTINWN